MTQSAVDPHVPGTQRGQVYNEVLEELDVTALVGAESDRVDVLVDRCDGDLLDRAVVSEVDTLLPWDYRIRPMMSIAAPEPHAKSWTPTESGTADRVEQYLGGQVAKPAYLCCPPRVRDAMSTFEVYDKATLSPHGDPQITILRAGILSLNQCAFAALDQPQAVELMFDRTQRVVGLHAVAASMRHACFLRPAGHSGHGNVLITAKAFLRHYGVDTMVSRRWPAWIEDDILCISLDRESTIVTSNRAGRPLARPA